MTFKLIVCLFLAYAVAFAQQAQTSLLTGNCGDPTVANRLEPGMRPPEIRNKFDPTFPAGSFREGIDATVKICFAIDTDGTPSHFYVTSGVDDALDAAALITVKQWRYIPAIQEDSRPIKVWVEVPETFVQPKQPPERQAPSKRHLPPE